MPISLSTGKQNIVQGCWYFPQVVYFLQVIFLGEEAQDEGGVRKVGPNDD